MIWRPIWRSGGTTTQEVTGSIPAQCKHLCAWTSLFVLDISMYNMYVFTNKKYISMYIYPLSRIHNISLGSAYFGLDKRECECLEYLFIYLCMFIRYLVSITQILKGV
jgi:hypothetical protein